VPMARAMVTLRRFIACSLVAAGLAGAAPSTGGATTIFTLTGHGWGHGIGMSQYGALGDSQHGWTYQQILTHYYSGTNLAALPGPVLERVLLASARSSFDVTAAAAVTVVDEGAAAQTSIPAGAYRVEPGSAGRIRVVDRATGAITVGSLVGPVRLVPGSHPLQIDSPVGTGWAHDHWHGSLRVIRTGSTLSLIDLVPLEYYLRGVVPSEMPASWPAPALRAQAVAARSYAYATRNPAGTFDAYADTRSQVYGPIEHEAAASTAAVTATTRQAVWYHGAVAVAFFSSSSGGVTASEQAAWGASSGQPYLVPVPDPYDGADGLNPNHTWAPRAYTPTQLGTAMALRPVGAVELHIDTASRRVLSLDAHTGAGTVSLTGPTVEVRMGLRSNYFRLVGVTLNAPVTVTAGTQMTLAGRVWPRQAGPVALERRNAPTGTWTTIVPSLGLAPDGTFSLKLSPLQNRQYRLATRTHAFSPQRFVHVAPALTLAHSGGRFVATMYPPIPGSGLRLQRHTASGWLTVQTAPTGPRGHATYTTPVTAGLWRVLFPGDAHHTAAASPVVTIAAVAGLRRR
jgi:stage II sporulation protein D